MTEPNKPSEWTYADYMSTVATFAEDALRALEEYPEDYENLHRAVESTIDGARIHQNHGYMEMVVSLSDTHPDSPDYTEPWTLYADLEDPTKAGVIGAMAYVCFYSDVMEKAKRLQEE